MSNERQSPSGRLAGRRIVITGAAKGIGLACAELFAEEGAALALMDVDGDALKSVSIRNSYGYAGDISSERFVADAIADAAIKMGGIDGVVNSAGTFRTTPIATTDAAILREFLEQNLVGCYIVCKAALPEMQKCASATIVNISTVGTLRPSPGALAYGAAKAGLSSITKTMAMELAPNIRANILCPGFITTPMTKAMYATEEERTLVGSGASVQKRSGTALEIAQAALFLTGEESRFMTGTNLVVDGGYAFY